MLLYVCMFAPVRKNGLAEHWSSTDVTYSLRLAKQSHVFAMYQFAGNCVHKTVVMRLSINSVPQEHTQSLIGDIQYGSNLGIWQGVLSTGTYKVTLEYHNNRAAPLSGGLWETRALTLIYC